MQIQIGNRRYSFITAQSRLWRVICALLPEFTLKREAKQKVARLKSLAKNLGINEPVNIVDVGANPLWYDAPYQPLLDAGLCKIVGFEPQAQGMAKLNAAKTDAETYFQTAVGDGKTHCFHEYSGDGLSSLFALNMQTIAHLPFLKDSSHIKSKTDVKTVRLDDIDDIKSIDFLKIDIQGGELLVLENARNKLSNALAVQVELRFMPLYIDEPRMGDIDLELARHGFDIHAGVPLVTLRIANSQDGNFAQPAARQILDGDFIYVRNLAKLDTYSDLDLKKLALLADGAFDSVPLTVLCIDILASRGAVQKSLAKTYFKSLPVRYKR